MGDLAALIFTIHRLGGSVEESEELVGLIIGRHASENDSAECRGCTGLLVVALG